MYKRFLLLLIVHSGILLTMEATNNKPPLHFETAQYAQKEFLIDFAIQSNDIYKTRIAGRDVAAQVFDLREDTFTHGVVELLKCGDEILGFFSLKIDKDHKQEHCELGHLFVKAGLQGNKLGTWLFEQAITVAREKKFKKMVWICDPDAQEFYVKKGAHITGYDQNLLNPSVPVPLFEYHL
jgi:GNAT superfamily N-acetyltransferase